jgi:hypothetical protein
MFDKLKNINKAIVILTTFSALSLFFLLFTDKASAVLLADLPGTKDADSNPGIYLKAIYRLTIGIAGVLAVLMIVIGGLEYIASRGNPGLMGDAKKRIWAAIGGLLIALSAVLILRTINPKLVEFELGLDKINIKKNTNEPSEETKTNSEIIQQCFLRSCGNYRNHLVSEIKVKINPKDIKNLCSDKTEKGEKAYTASKKQCDDSYKSCKTKFNGCKEKYKNNN